ncbi:MAG: M1 family metallopeptidase [Flavobacterium sp.]|nr:M1 family metallopeptidase [Flavobacterium sp.]
MKFFLLLIFSTFSFAQQIEKVDFIEMNAVLYPNAATQSISGGITYSFKVKSAIDTIRIDAKNMTFSDLLINGKEVRFKANKTHLLLFEGFIKGKNTLTFGYSATPKQALYFIGQGDELQIWTQGQGRYTSHWLPSFDDVNEKVIFNLNINDEYDFEDIKATQKTVLCNGILKEVVTRKSWSQGKDFISYQYTMQKPMSSYLVMLAIGNFIKKEEKANTGIPLEFYLDKNDSGKFESTYRYSKQIFDFFEKEIGVKYPWKVYRQVPVRDFLYAGMENTTATIFAQDYVVDDIGFNDRNYVNVNAHELAHQWFGDLITAKSGKHHWLQEGFATYYALLAEKEVFGDDYFHHQLYKTATQLRNATKTDTIPLLNEKASSLTFYQKGAWALHVLRDAIGEKAFNKAVKKYLKKYKFKNVETDDFLVEINKVSDFDTQSFKEKWLEKSGFEYHEAIGLLTKKNAFIAQYLEIKKQKELTNASFVSYIDDYRTILSSDAYYPIKQEIVTQIRNLDYKSNKDLIELALNSNNVFVRRTVAQSFPKIPNYLKTKYESLLNDNSYETREIAFINLWNSFPDNQNQYLELAKNWSGNNDKSSRILYLAYAQLTVALTADEKQQLFTELQNYTSTNFESSIRENAFEALFQLNQNDEIALRNLIEATSHFKWRFALYAKDKLKLLYKNNDTKIILNNLFLSLDDNQKNRMIKIVND